MLRRSERIDDFENLKQLDEEGVETRGVLAPQEGQVGRVQNPALHKRILKTEEQKRKKERKL